MQRRRFRTLVGLAAVGALALSACGSNGAASSSGDSYRILYVAGQTGVLSPTAIAIGRGIKAHVDAINAEGGLEGKEIVLETKDDQSDPTRGVTLVQEAMSGDDKADLVIPGVSSNEALAVAPLLERSRTVGIATVASSLLNDPKKYPYFFSAAFPADDAVKAAAVFLVKKAGVKKVALVAPADAIGDATEQNFTASLQAQGLTGVTFRFPSDGVDYTPTFQKAASSGADWMLMEGAGGQVPIMLSSREKAGADSIPTIVGPTASSQPLLDLATGDQLNNLYPTLLPTQVYIDPAQRSAEFRDFLSRVQKQGDLVTPIQVYANGWDMVRIWANAVKSSDGKTDGPTIKKALESEPEKKAGDQFPVYSGQYSANNHFHGGHPEDFTFAQLAGKKDGALLTK